METIEYDVVIVGGGIGGAVCAGLLARAKFKVLVLEKEAKQLPPNRAEILWEPSVKVLADLIPLSEWEKSAFLKFKGVCFESFKKKFSFQNEMSGQGHYITQPMLVREKLLNLGTFEVQRGIKVNNLIYQENKVVGIEYHQGSEIFRVKANKIIGDDGGKSAVRNFIGLDFKTKDFPIEFIAVPVKWHSLLDDGLIHGWIDWEKLVPGILAGILFPFADHSALLLFLVKSGSKINWQNVKTRNSVLSELLSEDDLLKVKPVMIRPYGHSAVYGKDEVYLMGDAIHPVSPAGGQGANMSVADAVALSRCIIEGKDILKSYQKLRHRANSRSLMFTRVAVLVVSLPNFIRKIIVSILLHSAEKISSVRNGILTYVSQAFVAKN